MNAAVLAAEPGLARAVKWGNSVFIHNGVHAVAVAMPRDHANLPVYKGALLAPDFAALEGTGTGRGMRHLRFRYTQEPDKALLQTVVRTSVEKLSAARASQH